MDKYIIYSLNLVYSKLRNMINRGGDNGHLVSCLLNQYHVILKDNYWACVI